MTGAVKMMNEFWENTYFKDMERTIVRHHEAREARLLERGEIQSTSGPDSAEMMAWEERESQVTFPFSNGRMLAYRAWRNSVQRGSSELECDNLPFPRDMADFSDTLKEAGCETLAVTEQSTALMRNLHALAKLGWTMDCLCTVTRTDSGYGCEENDEVQGIRMVRGKTTAPQRD